MSETATLLTIIEADVKKAVAFCKRRGIMMRYLIERALVEQLEDQIGLTAYRARRNERTFTLAEVLAGLRKKKYWPITPSGLFVVLEKNLKNSHCEFEIRSSRLCLYYR